MCATLVIKRLREIRCIERQYQLSIACNWFGFHGGNAEPLCLPWAAVPTMLCLPFVFGQVIDGSLLLRRHIKF